MDISKDFFECLLFYFPKEEWEEWDFAEKMEILLFFECSLFYFPKYFAYSDYLLSRQWDYLFFYFAYMGLFILLLGAGLFAGIIYYLFFTK